MSYIFVKILQITGDVETYIANKRNKTSRTNTTIQPYIIVVGPDVSQIDGCYLIIDDQIYEGDTVRKLFDTLFKVFLVFHAQYPLESEHIWYVIQKIVYGFSTEWDKKIPYVLTLIQDLTE